MKRFKFGDLVEATWSDGIEKAIYISNEGSGEHILLVLNERKRHEMMKSNGAKLKYLGTALKKNLVLG